MNVEIRGTSVIVTLSKRNLLALLDKLSWDDADPDAASARTLFREDESGTMLVVKAEQDEEHYRDRTPGKMHPKTEAAIARGI